MKSDFETLDDIMCYVTTKLNEALSRRVYAQPGSPPKKGWSCIPKVKFNDLKPVIMKYKLNDSPKQFWQDNKKELLIWVKKQYKS